MAPDDNSPCPSKIEVLQRENRLLHLRLDRDAAEFKTTIDELNAKIRQLTKEKLDLAYERDSAVDRDSSQPSNEALTKALEDAKSQIATLSREKQQSQLDMDRKYQLLEDGFLAVKKACRGLRWRRSTLDLGIDVLDEASDAFEALLNERGISVKEGPAKEQYPPSTNLGTARGEDFFSGELPRISIDLDYSSPPDSLSLSPLRPRLSKPPVDKPTRPAGRTHDTTTTGVTESSRAVLSHTTTIDPAAAPTRNRAPLDASPPRRMRRLIRKRPASCFRDTTTTPPRPTKSVKFGAESLTDL
ncbi:MAG: hypothetical protein LQ346_008687 [Caloplaca aetnensis]|nr:MAG: hypothetical protein LQ346_008687 [Caloplaca aetnensis]